MDPWHGGIELGVYVCMNEQVWVYQSVESDKKSNQMHCRAEVYCNIRKE